MDSYTRTYLQIFTYISSVRTQDAIEQIYQEWWMDGERERERESVNTVRLDDDNASQT